ncbi:hypothetical protein ACWFR5_44035 [Streptomyces sp. NPDC055092]
MEEQHALACNAAFDRAVLEREVQRAHGHDSAGGCLTAGRWEDAIAPCATWRGLWSAKLRPVGQRQDRLAQKRADREHAGVFDEFAAQLERMNGSGPHR